MVASSQQQQPAFLEIHSTKSTHHSKRLANFMLPHKTSYQRKRPRDQSACEGTEEQPSAKRVKAVSHNYPPGFWNALSKITLTRKALKEFDRRTAKEKATPIAGEVKRSARLLRSDTRQLKRLASNGGPNLNFLRGYAELPQAAVSMSKSSSRKGKRTRDSGLPSTDFTIKTSTTGPYNSHFQQMLFDRGVFPDGHEDSDGNIQEPANIDSLRELLPISRSSLSPSRFTNDDFKAFQKANRRAKSELKATSSVVPFITGAKDTHFETEENTQFNNLEKFAQDLKMAQPDRYYGARPSQINETVRHDLSRYIVPSTSTNLPVAPNFFFEGKSVAGRPDVAQRQIMHDNAYGARAIFELQNYKKEPPVYDGNAYTIGSTYSDGQLKLYATHPRQSASGTTEYYITQLDTYGMTGNIESFRRGAAAYRNSRDFTKELRDQLVAEANNIARSASTGVSNSTTGTSFAMANASFGSDTSTDELALHFEARPRKRVAQAVSTGPRRVQSTRVPQSNIQASNATVQKNQRRVQGEQPDGSDSADEEEYVTADGEQDETEDDDEDDVHAAKNGCSIPDEAASAAQRAQQAQSAMARCFRQGYSKDAAFNQLVVAYQESERVCKRVAVREVRKMLAFRI